MRQIDYDSLETRSCPVCEGRAYRQVVRRNDGGKIVQCDDCGHCYLNPTIPPTVLAEIYEQEYFVTGDDDAWLRLVDQWFLDEAGPYQRAISFIRTSLPRGAAICEVGCGVGRFLHQLDVDGYDVVGIEPSPKARQVAMSRFGLNVRPGYLAEPIRDDLVFRFDAVCSFEVVEHVYEPGDFLKLCGRLLRPGGTLILSTPNFALYHSMGKSYSDMHTQEHIQFFTRPSLAAVLDRCGFDLIDSSTGRQRRLGERLHKRMAPAVYETTLWQLLRKSKAAQAAKRLAFSLLDGIRTQLDASQDAGPHVLAFARKR